MSEDTVRLALPLLAAGQSQKELWHNEALARVDQLLQASVAAWDVDTPPAAPAAGESWIVGADPSGAWTGHAGAIATWTDAGWRFAAPTEGCTAWSAADGAAVRCVAGQWRLDPVRSAALTFGGQQVVGARLAAIADPDGGPIIDSAAREALSAVLAALRQHGLIASTP